MAPSWCCQSAALNNPSYPSSLSPDAPQAANRGVGDGGDGGWAGSDLGRDWCAGRLADLARRHGCGLNLAATATATATAPTTAAAVAAEGPSEDCAALMAEALTTYLRGVLNGSYRFGPPPPPRSFPLLRLSLSYV